MPGFGFPVLFHFVWLHANISPQMAPSLSFSKNQSESNSQDKAVGCVLFFFFGVAESLSQFQSCCFIHKIVMLLLQESSLLFI